MKLILDGVAGKSTARKASAANSGGRIFANNINH